MARRALSQWNKLNTTIRGIVGATDVSLYMYTVFPRNLAAATFNFVVQFGAATFRGRPDFEGGD